MLYLLSYDRHMSGTLYGIWGIAVKVKSFFKSASVLRWDWLEHEIHRHYRMRQITRSFLIHW